MMAKKRHIITFQITMKSFNAQQKVHENCNNMRLLDSYMQIITGNDFRAKHVVALCI